ncbi:hypothetical protein ACLMJK_003842 [Lecanora helva]
MSLHDCALTDLEQQDAQEVLKTLDIKFPSIDDDALRSPLVDFLKLQIDHPIKVFATTHWIHSKGLTLTSLCADTAFIEAINTSNGDLARIRKKVPGIERKRNHITRIERILQRPLEQGRLSWYLRYWRIKELTLFTPWTTDSLPEPFDLAVNCLSSLEHAIGLASHLSLEQLCHELNEAVNGDSVKQNNWRRKIGNGQKPLKRHFDTLATRLDATASSETPIAEPSFSSSRVNQRLRRKLRKKRNKQGSDSQLGKGLPEKNRQDQNTPAHLVEEESQVSIEHARLGSQALSDCSQDDQRFINDFDDTFTPGSSYQSSVSSPSCSHHDCPEIRTPSVESEIVIFGDELSLELPEEPVEYDVVDGGTYNSQTFSGQDARFLPQRIANSHSSVSGTSPQSSHISPALFWMQSSISMTAAPNRPPTPPSSARLQQELQNYIAAVSQHISPNPTISPEAFASSSYSVSFQKGNLVPHKLPAQLLGWTK